MYIAICLGICHAYIVRRCSAGLNGGECLVQLCEFLLIHSLFVAFACVDEIDYLYLHLFS